MIKIKAIANKTWVFIAAAALISGSNTAMAFTLNHNVPGSVAKNVLTSKAVTKTNLQNQIGKTTAKAEYNVIDLSKNGLTEKSTDAIKAKYKNLSKEQLEQKYKEFEAMMIPDAKDMKADQAAAYAADILTKAYGVSFRGYTAQASFSKGSVPNSDSWTVIFYVPNGGNSSYRYLATVDSVSGKMENASCYNFVYSKEGNNKDVKDPSWINAAKKAISKLLPQNVKMKSNKVISATAAGGVMVVCDLSDGSAIAVRLDGANKLAVAYEYFSDGYDGSWDVQPVTENGVG